MSTWLLIEVDDIADVGINEKQRILIDDSITIRNRGTAVAYLTVDAVGVVVHPATRE